MATGIGETPITQSSNSTSLDAFTVDFLRDNHCRPMESALCVMFQVTRTKVSSRRRHTGEIGALLASLLPIWSQHAGLRSGLITSDAE